MLAARVTCEWWRDAVAMEILMITRGLTELVILGVAWTSGSGQPQLIVPGSARSLRNQAGWSSGRPAKHFDVSADTVPGLTTIPRQRPGAGCPRCPTVSRRLVSWLRRPAQPW